MTDNGSCYRSFAWRDACKALGIKHIRTKPYTPRTNGKAERFIQSPCANGPMPKPIQTPGIEPWSSHTGYTITIGTAPMPG